MTQNFADSINNKFSETCKRYTDVMAHKHKLQSLLFMINENITEARLAAGIASSIIILENGASKLRSFVVCLLSTYNNCLHYIIISSVLQLQYCVEPCVEFTADQYLDILNFKFHNQETLNASLSTSVANWKNANEVCKTKNQCEIQLNK